MTKMMPFSNQAIAAALEQAANLLEEAGDNPHRIQAYRYAAQTVAHTEQPLAEMLADGGMEALRTLPGVGESLASRIAGFLHTGQLALIEELREAYAPERLFVRVAGIGEELARRIHDELHLETLEALEVAAYDGRLERLEGFGPRRVRAIRQQLNTMLSRDARLHIRQLRRAARQGPAPHHPDQPTVADLLNVDFEYRTRSSRDELERIAPRRFNPTGEAWLPVLHTRRGLWVFSALFSNTARAHELERTRDWVVIYAEREGREQQCTVVTETRGDLQGLRVVRGREAECRAYYAERRPQAA